MDDSALQQTKTPPHCRDREETGVIRPTAHVRVVGLQNRSDLNGRCAVIAGDYHLQKERWPVQVDSGESVMVKSSNIRVDAIQPAHVPSAKAWLAANVPPGMKFMPKMPPIRLPGMPPLPTAEEKQQEGRQAARSMAAYAKRNAAAAVAERSPAVQGAIIPQVAAGRLHTIWISADGKMHSCGAGDFEDCTGGDQDVDTGDTPPSEALLQFCGGSTRSTPTDCKFTAHLGHGVLEMDSIKRMPSIVRMPSTPYSVVEIAAGALHSMALDDAGATWSWGWGGNGRLGLGDVGHRTLPTRITEARMTGGGRSPDVLPRIKQVTCGTEHSQLLTCEGQILSCGRDHLGQLGLGRLINEDDWSPTAQVYPMGGFNDDALLPTLISWHCPDGPAQQRSMIAKMGIRPSMITEALGSSVRFQQVSAGGEHGLALSNCGTVFAWGCPWQGRLGRPPPWDYIAVPTRVPFPSSVQISKVSAGKFCSIALAADGNVFTWGEFGTGFSKEMTSPTRLPALDPKKLGDRVLSIHAGSEAEHSLVVTASGRALRLDKAVTPLGEVDQEVVMAAVGSEHSALLLASGELRGLGKGGKGQLAFVNAEAVQPLGVAPSGPENQHPQMAALKRANTVTAAKRADGNADGNADTLDSIFDQAEALGLLAEAERDKLTDAIARGEVTTAALEKAWADHVAAFAIE